VKPYRGRLPDMAVALLEQAREFEREFHRGKDGVTF
jgi:hypothetical protein